MTACVDEGRLRTYVDEAMSLAERRIIAVHLGACADCQRQIEHLRSTAAQVERVLDMPTPPLDPQLALARLRQKQATAQPNGDRSPTLDLASSPQTMFWRNLMQQIARLWTGPRRIFATGFAALVIILSLLAFPPVRAAASRMLDVFRVQRVILMPISPDRIAQLENLDFDASTLFVAKPKLVNQPADPRTVASAAEASQVVGFPVQEVTALPNDLIDTRTQVLDRMVYQLQINVESARQLLSLLEIHDVVLPDVLGTQPIVADVAPMVETRYNGRGYNLRLYQGYSPTMTLPEGTNLQQMGRAALRLLGMQPDQADALSRQIDWTSTFIFPIPPGVTDVRQVTIGDAQGMLVGVRDLGDSEWLLYWQRGERFYVLQGQGMIDEGQMIAAAEWLR